MKLLSIVSNMLRPPAPAQHLSAQDTARQQIQTPDTDMREDIRTDAMKVPLSPGLHVAPAAPTQVVRLQVRQTAFTTTVTTLAQAEEGSCLHRLARLDSAAHLRGRYFIDADPVLFVNVLAYLRSRIVPDHLTPLQAQALAKQAQALGLHGLKQGLASSLSVAPEAHAPGSGAHTWWDAAAVVREPPVPAEAADAAAVRISVQGRVFSLSAAACARIEEGSLLAVLLNADNGFAACNDGGLPLVDAHPGLFVWVAHFLHARFLPHNLSLASAGQLADEAAYLGLWQLEEEARIFYPLRHAARAARDTPGHVARQLALADCLYTHGHVREAHWIWAQARRENKDSKNLYAALRIEAKACQKKGQEGHLALVRYHQAELMLQHNDLAAGQEHSAQLTQCAPQLLLGWKMSASFAAFRADWSSCDAALLQLQQILQVDLAAGAYRTPLTRAQRCAIFAAVVTHSDVDASAQMTLGLLHLHNREHKAASAALERAYVLQSNHPLVCFLLAEALLLRDGTALRAKALAEQGLVQLPNASVGRWLKGCALLRLGQRRQAEMQASGALLLDRTSGRAHILMGLIQCLQHNYRIAETHFAKACFYAPHNASSYYNLGTLLLRRQRYANAIDSLSTATVLQPDNSLAWHGLGEAYFAVHGYVHAEHAWRQVLALDMQDIHAWQRLGDVLYAQNRAQEATQATARARVLRMGRQATSPTRSYDVARDHFSLQSGMLR